MSRHGYQILLENSNIKSYMFAVLNLSQQASLSLTVMGDFFIALEERDLNGEMEKGLALIHFEFKLLILKCKHC